jgi:ribosomal protein S18 acetylase RimI-like enzyme
VWELYVDPAAHRSGGGSALLAAAEAWLDAVGLHHQVLSVLRGNTAAQAFYRSAGWEPTGRVVPVDLGVVAFEEIRYRRTDRGGADRP